jgi:hypothetical protein
MLSVRRKDPEVRIGGGICLFGLSAVSTATEDPTSEVLMKGEASTVFEVASEAL